MNKKELAGNIQDAIESAGQIIEMADRVAELLDKDNAPRGVRCYAEMLCTCLRRAAEMIDSDIRFTLEETLKQLEGGAA